MDNQIEAKEIWVKQLFGTSFLFEIPGYQRPFSWETENFDQLFEDIKTAMETEEHAYFLGSVILQAKRVKVDGSAVYDVVDGQQRLTSLSILLATMRDLVKDDVTKKVLQSALYQEAIDVLDVPEQVRLSVREKDQLFFKEHVLLSESTTHSIQISGLPESQTHMVQAIQCFRSKFLDDSAINEHLLNQMVRFILNKCMFVYVRTGTFTSAYRLFSVLNDRGMPLTPSDLLKSTNLGSVPDNVRDRYQRKWEHVEEELGRDELDQILAHIRTILVKEKARKSIVDEYEQIVYTRNASFKGAEFIDYLETVSGIYKQLILDAELDSGDVSLDVRYFNLMSLMRDFILNNDWVPVFLSFSHKFTDKETILDFTEQLEKLVISDWMQSITPTARIVKMNRLLGIIEKNSIAQNVLDDDVFDLSNLTERLSAIIDSHDLYRRKYTKYLLLRLDLSYVENKNVIKAYKGTISVEHVLPQNPRPEWSKKFSDAEKSSWTHRIANLVLLSKHKNSAANNRPFAEKIKKYLYTGGVTDFEITKAVADYSDWTPDVLTGRQSTLVKQIVKLYS